MMNILVTTIRSWIVSAFPIVVGIICSGSLSAQSQLVLIGEPRWEIKNGVCNFSLSADTKIINQAPTETLSGPLGFSLVMTANPFPDVATLVSAAEIGQLPDGYEFSNFSVPAPVEIPSVTGYRYFTLTVEEFTSSGWVTRFGGGSSLVYLRQGVVGTPPIWKPKGQVIPLPVLAPFGLKVVFSQKALQVGGKTYVVPKSDQYSVSARLSNSGRTVVYRSTIPKGAGADWTYKSGNAKWQEKNCRVGVLVIDYGVAQGVSAKSTYRLFFQKDGRGFYQATYVVGKESVTSWGLFTLG